MAHGLMKAITDKLDYGKNENLFKLKLTHMRGFSMTIKSWLVLCFLTLPFFANAQIPSHALGQICFTTQNIWCWTDQNNPGVYVSPETARIQRACTCPSAYGALRGFYDQNDLMTYMSSANSAPKNQPARAAEPAKKKDVVEDLKKIVDGVTTCDSDEAARSKLHAAFKKGSQDQQDKIRDLFTTLNGKNLCGGPKDNGGGTSKGASDVIK